jgi:type IV secretory pathway VirB4 component
MFVLGLPGLGKSSFIRHMLTSCGAFGNLSIILGDLKGEYIALTRKLKGQVIRLGTGGRGYLNILDPGNAREAIDILQKNGFQKEANEIKGDVHMRQLNMVCSLISILRKNIVTNRETNILSRSLEDLNNTFIEKPPVLSDLLELIRNPTQNIRDVALDRGSESRYKEITEQLEISLIGLTQGGTLGEIFAEQTTEKMRLDKSICYDVSSIDDSQEDLQAAILLACWSEGFANIKVGQVLADCGLIERKHYLVTLDELWRALRSGAGMVDRVDALTRLNRQRGVGLSLITHTMSDLEALKNEEDKKKAKGFIERAGMVICGGLPSRELKELEQIVKFTNAEKNIITEWTSPPTWEGDETPGRGKFMIKVGNKPGIPFKVQLTEAEKHINDTNQLWNEDK